MRWFQSNKNVHLKCKLPFGLAMLLQRPEEGTGINAVKQSLSATKMLLWHGCEILPLGECVLMRSLRPAGSWATASGLFWLLFQFEDINWGKPGNCCEFLLCHCNESFDFRDCQSPASPGLLEQKRGRWLIADGPSCAWMDSYYLWNKCLRHPPILHMLITDTCLF